MINFGFTEKNNFENGSLCIFLFNKKKFEEPGEALTKYEIEYDSIFLENMFTDNNDTIVIPGKKAGAGFTILFKVIDTSKPNSLRLTGSNLANFISDQKFESINLEVYPAIKNSSATTFRELMEGIKLGSYKFDKYKTDKSEETNKTVNFITSYDLGTVIGETELLFKGVNFSRDLSNEPANVLTPQSFANSVNETLTLPDTSVEILNEVKLRKMGFNLITTVGEASTNPPCMIKIHYKPEKPKKKIALVGKGVTYDAGGLSIKTTQGMFEMKADMAGAGSVAGAIYSAALNKLPYEIIGLLPAVENMLAGNSYKPGDVLTGYKGKTVEIGDTDAEGRLILADALEYANEFKPDYIIDLATLTGAAFISFGYLYAAMFTENEILADTFEKAGKNSYELVWQMPLTKEYKSLLDTKMADVSNIGPRHSGAITAALFLQHFVDENIPWMHLDIAGPSIKNDILDYNKNYNTGYGVRLIYQALKSGKL